MGLYYEKLPQYVISTKIDSKKGGETMMDDIEKQDWFNLQSLKRECLKIGKVEGYCGNL